MPNSHDRKPRNRMRRIKARLKFAQQSGPSARSLARRLLRQAGLDACVAQQKIERDLRAYGLNWRAVEKAVQAQEGGRWSGLGRVCFELPGFVEVAKTNAT